MKEKRMERCMCLYSVQERFWRLRLKIKIIPVKNCVPFSEFKLRITKNGKVVMLFQKPFCILSFQKSEQLVFLQEYSSILKKKKSTSN